VEAPRSDDEAGILPEPSRTIIMSEAASGSTVRESSDAKIKYKYGDAFEEAEFISSTPIKRVAQARRYKDVRRNFIGSRNNFELDPQDKRSQREIMVAKESDVTRQQWRARMFSAGTMSVDAIMMVCHPNMYRAIIDSSPDYFEAAIPEQERLRAFKMWMTMKTMTKLSHRVDDTMLPDLELWDRVGRSNPLGVGITLPNGRVIPEGLASTVSQYSGLVVVNEAMVDKLAKVKEQVGILFEMVTGKKSERQVGPRPAVKDRLGPDPSTPKESAEDQLAQQGRRVGTEVLSRAVQGPQGRSVGTVEQSSILVLSGGVQEQEEVSDMDAAEETVRDIELETHIGAEDEIEQPPQPPHRPGVESRMEVDSDCEIIETCIPMALVKTEGQEQGVPVKSAKRPPGDLEVTTQLETPASVAAPVTRSASIVPTQAPTQSQAPRTPEGAPVQTPIQPRIPRTPGRLPSPEEVVAEEAEQRIPQFAGPYGMNPNIRATGMGMSSGRPPRSSGSEDSDEGGVVDGMMHRAITGNMDSEDGDDVGPSRTKRRKNNNNNKKAYTGRPRVPYQMPDDDEPEPEQHPPQLEVEKEVELQPQQVPMGPVNSACPEYYATHMSWPLPEGYEDARVGRADGACKEALCVARRPWFRRSEYKDHDTEYYDTKSMADALMDCTMGEGTKYDLTPRNRKSLKIFTLGKVGVTMEGVSPSWGFLRPQIIKSEFYLSCIKGGRVSLDVEKYIPDALRAYESKYGLTKEELAHAFTVVHMGAPNGVIVQVRAMFDGKVFHGKEIPEDLKSLLRNEGVRKMGFGVTKDVELLRAAGVEVESVCDLHSVVLMLWPQWELHQPKTSKWFVKEMLRAPCPIYTYGQERPLGGMKIIYNKMDFALPVDQWDPLWSYYNAMDHGLAFAIMDYASARAANLDNLNMAADVVRYTLDILDAIRDLPADPMGARRHKSCDRFKLETDEDRGKQKFWPLTTDYDMYVRFRDRVGYKERVPRKHKPDREQFEEEYLGDLESRVGAKVESRVTSGECSWVGGSSKNHVPPRLRQMWIVLPHSRRVYLDRRLYLPALPGRGSCNCRLSNDSREMRHV
jgi:hypothetical protein